MKVKINEDGYVVRWCDAGENGSDIEVATPDGFDPMHYGAYRLTDGALTLDADRLTALQLAEKIATIRARREKECYSVINRGQLWYEGISLSRLAELRKWYKAWRDAPATMVIPDRPDWLD